MKHICESCEFQVNLNDSFCSNCGSQFDIKETSKAFQKKVKGKSKLVDKDTFDKKNRLKKLSKEEISMVTSDKFFGRVDGFLSDKGWVAEYLKENKVRGAGSKAVKFGEVVAASFVDGFETARFMGTAFVKRKFSVPIIRDGKGKIRKAGAVWKQEGDQIK